MSIQDKTINNSKVHVDTTYSTYKTTFKGITQWEKRCMGWTWQYSKGLPLSYSSRDFTTNQCRLGWSRKWFFLLTRNLYVTVSTKIRIITRKLRGMTRGRNYVDHPNAGHTSRVRPKTTQRILFLSFSFNMYSTETTVSYILPDIWDNSKRLSRNRETIIDFK